MQPKKPLIIAIAVIGIVLLITAIILVIIKNGNKDDGAQNTEPTDSTTAAIITTIDGYDITGVWYSDRQDKDVLTLDPSGTYTSTVWLAAGTFSVEGDNIALTDNYGTTKKLTYKIMNDAPVLFFDNAAYSHSYYRTEQAATQAATDQQQQDEDMKVLYNAALQQILTTEEWKDNTGNTTLSFTEKDYTVTYTAPDGTKQTVTCKYAVTDIQVDGGNYRVKWIMTDENNIEYNITDVSISVKNGNEYTIYSSSFSFARTFTKTVDIEFVEPGTANAAHGSDTSTSTRQISRDDNPDDNEFLQETFAEIDKALIGTWKGCFDDNPTDQTVYWVYTFNEDGTYSFSHGEYEETGTFTISHTNESRYNTIITMKHGDETTVQNIYLSGTSPIRMITEDDTDPTYRKV